MLSNALTPTGGQPMQEFSATSNRHYYWTVVYNLNALRVIFHRMIIDAEDFRMKQNVCLQKLTSPAANRI